VSGYEIKLSLDSTFNIVEKQTQNIKYVIILIPVLIHNLLIIELWRQDQSPRERSLWMTSIVLDVVNISTTITVHSILGDTQIDKAKKISDPNFFRWLQNSIRAIIRKSDNDVDNI
jgi:hypothetical protein